MIAAFVISISIALLFVFWGYVFLTGKGDMLMAGYNTASEERRKQYDITRLRRLMATLSFTTAGYCCLLPVIGSYTTGQLVAAGVFITLLIVIIIFANTWAKKK